MSLKIGLICSSERRPFLEAEIRHSGLEPVSAIFKADDVQGVLIDGGSRSDEILTNTPDLINRLKQSQGKVLSVLVSQEQAESEDLDFDLTPSVEGFSHQVKLAHRLSEMAQEASLRQMTISTFGSCGYIPDSETAPASNFVLFLGEPSAFYLKCRKWIGDAGYGVKAVLSERTAFDFLNLQRPAAVILQLEDDSFPSELVDHIHGRRDLLGMPVIAVTNFTRKLADLSEGITGLIRIGSKDTSTQTTVLSLLTNREQRLPRPSGQCPSPVRDRYSDAFSKDFAERHIHSQAVQAKISDNALSVGVIFPFYLETGEPIRSSDLSVFSRLLETIVRRQDMIARLDWTRFLISQPGCTASQAEKSLERVRHVMETTTPKLKSDGPFSFSFRIFDLAAYQRPGQIWHHASEFNWQKPKSYQSSVA